MKDGVTNLAPGKLGCGCDKVQLGVRNGVCGAEVSEPELATLFGAGQGKVKDGVEAAGEGIVEAIEGIYKVFKWIIHNAASIFTLIETIVNGIVDILAGNITGMANAIESALAALIPPVIDFLADFFGLGDIPEKVRDAIVGFQEKVLSFVDKALMWMIEKGKGLLAAVGIGDKKKPDKRTPEEKQAALDNAIAESEALIKKPGIEEHEIRAELPLIKVRHNMTSLELVVDNMSGAKETVHVEGEINPKKPSKPATVSAEIVTKLTISRASWDKTDEGTQQWLSEQYPDEHKKDRNKNVRQSASGTYLLKTGYGRRHVLSHNDMATHYEKVLNGTPDKPTTWAKAKILLGETGCPAAQASGAVIGKLSNEAIQAAAKGRHGKFFNLTENLFVGKQRKNSSIGENVDPDHPEMRDKPGAVDEHVAKMIQDWALDPSSFEVSDKYGVLGR